MISVFSSFAISSGKCSFEQELHILNPALLHATCCLFIFFGFMVWVWANKQGTPFLSDNPV